MKKIIKWFSLVVFVCFLIHSAVLLAIGLRDTATDPDTIVVFGNTVQEDGIPSPRLRSRLDRAIALYDKKNTRFIFVSGGVGKEGFDEAGVMKKYLLDHDITEHVIITDSNGYTTYQTAKNLRSFALDHELGKITIVSQYYHILRAKAALEKFGFDNITSAHSKIVELRDLYSIPREFFAFYFYLFRRADI